MMMSDDDNDDRYYYGIKAVQQYSVSYFNIRYKIFCTQPVKRIRSKLSSSFFCVRVMHEKLHTTVSYCTLLGRVEVLFFEKKKAR